MWFVQQVERSRIIWTLLDGAGCPVQVTRKGKTYRLLWSTAFRLRRALRNLPEYVDYAPTSIAWEQFRDEWVPEMERTGVLACLDWTGRRAIPLYHISGSAVQMLVEYRGSQFPRQDE